MATLRSWGRTRKMEILRHMDLFSTCSMHELGQVAALTVQAHLDEGTVLTRQGQAGGLAYVIESGTAEVVQDGIVIATLGPGAVVGELSLIDGRPRSATVRATSPLEVLQISGKDLGKLLAGPNFRRKLLQALAERVRAVDALPNAV